MSWQMPTPFKIVRLEGKRCLVVPAGGWWRVDKTTGMPIDWSDDCIVTEDGYKLGKDNRPWPGALPERLHPWPPE